MYFRVFHHQASGYASYLLGDVAAKEAVLIDPQISDIAVTGAILNDQKLRLTSLLFTHEHDQAKLSNVDIFQAYSAHFINDMVIVPAGHKDFLTFGDERIEIIKTPGHTLKCQSFLWRDRLFCGDLLSVDICPHQPRPISPADLWDSVTQKILLLPAETFLFTGHSTKAQFLSTILQQRLWHPWFSGATRDAFFARIGSP